MAVFVAKTLTNVHIGSGRTLVKNMDFAIGKRMNDDNEPEDVIGILDINKISKVIGIENIEKLIEFIDRKGQKNVLEFVKQNSVNKNFSLDNISKRLLAVYGNFEGNNFLKEHLHNSDQNCFIPGSSVKGAIRTAIISHLVKQNKQIVRGIIDREQKFKPFAQWQQKDFEKLETKIINKLLSGTDGIDANKNVMRFLIVGDVEFQYETIAKVMEILNYYPYGWEIKQGQTALIELIPPECESEPFRININKELLDLNLKNEKIIVRTDFLKDIDTIFNIVNKHTKQLVENELNFWNNQNSNTDNAESYINDLENILHEFSELKQGEMILRLGGNSGWTSITGGWAKDILSEMEWNKLYHILNKGRDVDIFPKTRKISQDGEMMGFVKISKSS